MNRVFTLDSPHGDDLKFHTLDGSDELGRLFEFRIEALADSHSLSLKDMLGKPVTVRIEQQDLSTRYLNGIVARASLAGRRAERYYGYELIVRPWLWLATRRSDCRIFQNKTVPEIVQEVLSTYGFPIESHLAETYSPRDYCVQYNETDAAFVSRLMEFEGIYFWFRHAEDTHTLMLGDAMSSHTALPGYETIPYIARDRTAIADEERIDGWLPAQEVSVGRHQTTDYDYTKPRADLSSQKVDPRGHDHDSFASFEWPGGYRDDAPGAHYSRVRLEEQQAEHERASADTDVRGVAPGYLFTLERCPRADQNREYLIVRCQYRFQENAYASDQGAEAVVHQTMMLVQPSSLPYRSSRDTPRPRTNGPQTATVVGPPGEEIWTDQYGRVKLQFRWDRYGQSNQDSSCWVRVSSPWAGGGFGGVQMPR
ncbi:type VI secretion system tip protein VgrG, partial [Burkholderia cepacia]|uniref:type VI secretion system tip protein TssI/VgrG n=1 Tax=Burkholderia cepacia TaxID=292 RepID=UPI00106880FA